MIKRYWLLLGLTTMFSVALISWKIEKKDYKVGTIASAPKISIEKITDPSPLKGLFMQYVSGIYQSAQLQDYGLEMDVFQRALTGFVNLKMANLLPQSSYILTVIDLNKSSCQKRMWVINLLTKEMLLNTWVAHGRTSGEDVANYFSNDNNSDASSVGFYLTSTIYEGKHGRSLRLDGLDEGFNTNARNRGIVIHAAPYVGQGSIDKLGRLGHSEGCPAVSPKVIKKVISTLKDRTAIFINGNEPTYTSRFLDEDLAASFLFPNTTPNTGDSSVLISATK